MQLYKVTILFVFFSIVSHTGFSNYSNELIKTGNGFLSRGDVHQAIFFYSEAIFEDPSSVIAYIHRAEAYLLIENYDAAMTDYRIAIEIDPELVKELIYQKKRGSYDGRSDLFESFTNQPEVNMSTEP